MKTRIVAALCLCCALALGAALSGCAANIDKSGFLGDWKMTSSNDVNLDDESLKMADSLGLRLQLTLNEDGTGSLAVLSDEKSVSWEAKSETEGTLTIDGEQGTMQVGESGLSVDVGDSQMTFERP